MHTLAEQLHHLPTVAHTHGAQAYEGYLQSHVSNTEGAFIGIAFIVLMIVVGLRAGLRSGGRN